MGFMCGMDGEKRWIETCRTNGECNGKRVMKGQRRWKGGHGLDGDDGKKSKKQRKTWKGGMEWIKNKVAKRI